MKGRFAMESQPDVEQLIQKTRQYEFADGLRDLQLAVLFGFGGVTSWLAFEPFWIAIIGNTAKTYGRWAAWIGMLPLVLVMLAVWGMLPIMNFLRKRWLWRESGMVKPSRWIVPRRVNVLTAVIMLGGIAGSLGLRALGWADDAFVLRVFWAATGWGFGYTLFAMGRHMDLPRYRQLGVIGGFISTILLFLPLRFGQSSLVFGFTWFTLLAVSGFSALRRASSGAKVAR